MTPQKTAREVIAEFALDLPANELLFAEDMIRTLDAACFVIVGKPTEEKIQAAIKAAVSALEDTSAITGAFVGKLDNAVADPRFMPTIGVDGDIAIGAIVRAVIKTFMEQIP